MPRRPSLPSSPPSPELSRLAVAGYLGPEGSWTHQAAIALMPAGVVLRPFEAAALVAACEDGAIDAALLPVSTTIVGATPYLDAVRARAGLRVLAEHRMMLGYSLLARPGATLAGLRELRAHPVAFAEVRPWCERMLPAARCVESASGGAAAREVAASGRTDIAAFGPPAAAALHGLVPLAEGIEEGPHNVTTWWLLARTGEAGPAPE